MRKSLTCGLLASIFLTGCFWNKKTETPYVMKLGDLIPLQVSGSQRIVPVTTAQQIARYRSLLQQVQSGKLRAQIQARLANLEIIHQGQLADQSFQENGDDFVASYDTSIDQYQSLLKSFPDKADNDIVLYQLAKAYDLSGNTNKALLTLNQLVKNFPNSSLLTESYFRLGEYYFAFRRFAQAEIAFTAVLTKTSNNAFAENARYMLAWSYFKQNKYPQSIATFSQILDELMPANGAMELVAENKMTLVEDSIRVQALIFSYLDGVASLESFYRDKTDKSYLIHLYESLATLLKEKERYSDAVATYRAYIRSFPSDKNAPLFANNMIETMKLGGFYSEIFDAKADFVSQYHIQSAYFQSAWPDTQDYILPYLLSYLDEIGRTHHANAQKVARSIKRSKQPTEKQQNRLVEVYQKAIDSHHAFLNNFPEHYFAAERAYWIAEAFAESNQWLLAAKAYESAAYDFPINLYAEKSAYSALLAYEKIARSKLSNPLQQDQLLAVKEAFIAHFTHSQYVKPLLLSIIDTYYQAKDFAQAVRAANEFMQRFPDAKDEDQVLLYLVIGHSHFEKSEFTQAEKNYRQALAKMPNKDKDYRDLKERTTATIYKQAEQLAKNNKKAQAVETFLRVGSFSPNSSYRKTAEYDAATYLIQLSQWQNAINLLEGYRKRYDPKKTNLDITGKLVACYEGLDQLDLAANELKRVFRDEKDAEKQRQALFLAAEYYEKAEQDDKALAAFRDYAHRYPEPFDLAMETRFRLSEMYRKQKDINRRNYWLDKIIVADMRAGEKRTARSKYLGAMARNVFAESYFEKFKSIKLTMPLSRSLPKKKSAMSDALKRYEKIMEYKIQEFSTLATFKVANIYAVLSKDILDAERPSGLDELELEEFELILEEQAYPFEEKSTEIHLANLENSWHGNYDKWVAQSISNLAKLNPVMYKKEEEEGDFSEIWY